jgi:hypothetical protein
MARLRRRVAALRRPAGAVPNGDLHELRRSARRTRAIRLLLALVIAGLLAGAVAAASTERTRSDIVPSGTASILVVDLSKSVVDQDLLTVGATLRRLIESDTPTGLVFFSDVPYEVLPPGSSPRGLEPLLRFFLAQRGGSVPPNPWQATFRAGTRISEALKLAREMLARDKVADGSIVLLSDLETAPSDFAILTQTLADLRHDKVALRVVPLRPTDRGRALFSSVLGDRAILPTPTEAASSETVVRRTLHGSFPLALLLLGGFVLLCLAGNELWCARLALPRAAPEQRS